MPRVDWSAVGKRYYEAGVDRGVLYVGGAASAWSGLVNVKTSLDGSTSTPYYVDGVRIANFDNIGDLKLTIEAYSSPALFDLCEGLVTDAGISYAMQRRQEFALTWRTKIGTDQTPVDSPNGHYRLHIAYNCLATPASRDYATLNDSPDARTILWDVESHPEPTGVGKRDTAYIVIDSRKVSPGFLAMLELYLYGGIGYNPRLATPTQIQGFLQAWAEISNVTSRLNIYGDLNNPTTTPITNFANNPNFEQVLINRQELRRNRTLNPVPSSITGYSAIGNASIEFATSPPPNYNLVTCTAGALDSGIRLPAAPVNAGDKVTYSIEVEGIVAGSWRLRVSGTATSVQTSPVIASPGQVRRFGITVTHTSAGTPTVELLRNSTSGAEVARVRRFLDELTPKYMQYFGGTESTTDPEAQSEWTGVVGASQSILTVPTLSGVPSASNNIQYATGDRPIRGGKSLRNYLLNSNAISIAVSSASLTTDQIYTMITAVNARDRAQSLTPRIRGNVGLPVVFDQNTWTEFRMTLPAGSGSVIQTGFAVSAGSGHQLSDQIDVGYVALVEGSYDGPYFDGSSNSFVYKNQRCFPRWLGLPNLSQSRVDLIDEFTKPGVEGDAWIYNGYLWAFQNGIWDRLGPATALA